MLNRLDQKLKVSLQEQTLFIQLSDVIMICAESNYSRIYTKEGQPIMSARPLSYYVSQISKDLFFRSHQSFFINLKEIKGHQKGKGGHILLSSGHEAALAKHKVNEFYNRMQEI